jgi:hypothetical protein
MSEIEGEIGEGQDVEVHAVTPPEPEAQAPERDPELEAEARKYGWKPKDEFTLAPDGWMDADRFLEAPATRFKRERDTRKATEKELAEVREQLSRVAKVTEQTVAAREAQIRADYEARWQRLQAEKVEAVETADVEKFKAVEAQEQRLRQSQPAQPAARAPEVTSFLGTVPWGSDEAKVEVAKRIIDTTPGALALPTAKQLEIADRKMREFYPELYEVTPPAPPRVDGGGLGGARRGPKGADDLPADVRKVGKEFVEQGLFKSLGDYAKKYWEQEA